MDTDGCIVALSSASKDLAICRHRHTTDPRYHTPVTCGHESNTPVSHQLAFSKAVQQVSRTPDSDLLPSMSIACISRLRQDLGVKPSVAARIIH